MSPYVTLLLLSSALIVAPPAHAQSVEPVRASSAGAPMGSVFHAGFSTVSPNSERVVEIFSNTGPESPPRSGLFERRYFAQQRTNGLTRRIDAESCPALFGVIEEIQDFVGPRIDFPTLYGTPRAGSARRTPPIAAPDGESFSIWGSGRQPDGSLAQLVTRGSHGLIRDFVLYAESALEPCWRRSAR